MVSKLNPEAVGQMTSWRQCPRQREQQAQISLWQKKLPRERGMERWGDGWLRWLPPAVGHSRPGLQSRAASGLCPAAVARGFKEERAVRSDLSCRECAAWPGSGMGQAWKATGLEPGHDRNVSQCFCARASCGHALTSGPHSPSGTPTLSGALGQVPSSLRPSVSSSVKRGL